MQIENQSQTNTNTQGRDAAIQIINGKGRELLRSVDGRHLPGLGEVAVYWPTADFTNIFDSTGFAFTDEPNNRGDGEFEYPELIQHDAEATALVLLTALNECISAYEQHRDNQPTGHLWPDPNHIFHSRAAVAATKSRQG
jgi:hypothetical protein